MIYNNANNDWSASNVAASWIEMENLLTCLTTQAWSALRRLTFCCCSVWTVLVYLALSPLLSERLDTCFLFSLHDHHWALNHFTSVSREMSTVQLIYWWYGISNCFPMMLQVSSRSQQARLENHCELRADKHACFNLIEIAFMLSSSK